MRVICSRLLNTDTLHRATDYCRLLQRSVMHVVCADGLVNGVTKVIALLLLLLSCCYCEHCAGIGVP
jgi:hypothetical protein